MNPSDFDSINCTNIIKIKPDMRRTSKSSDKLISQPTMPLNTIEKHNRVNYDSPQGQK